MPKIVDHDERRQLYIDALWRVVERDGAAAVSIRTVAAEAGMSKSNISYYFDSRSSLLAAAIRSVVADARSRAATIDSATLSLEQMVRMVMLMIPDSAPRRRQTALWLLLVAQYASDEEVRPILHELNREVRVGITNFLQRIADQGDLGAGRDVELEATRLHALVDGISLQAMSDSRLMPVAEIRATVEHHLRELQRSVR